MWECDYDIERMMTGNNVTHWDGEVKGRQQCLMTAKLLGKSFGKALRTNHQSRSSNAKSGSPMSFESRDGGGGNEP